jgi:Uma2 family endonuclease
LIPKTERYSYEQFLELTKDVERAELIDGEIYMLASPSPEHQRISMRLSNKLFNYLQGSNCEVFTAPLDVVLENEATDEKQSVQPDLVIICDKSKFTTINYTGVPELVIEILSPSTTSKDTIKKMDLYMKFGVKEYWIIKPKSKAADVYLLEDGVYTEPMAYSKDDILRSNIFDDLSIELKAIFE